MLAIDKILNCRLILEGREHDAVLHLVETKFTDALSFWNGVLSLIAEPVRSRTGNLENLKLKLSDGRDATMLKAIHVQIIGPNADLAGPIVIDF
jgi:hypothetical protein